MAKSSIVVTEASAVEAIAQATGIRVNDSGQVQVGAGEPARGRERDNKFEHRMAVIENRKKFLPVVPATVFNFLPIKIVVNAPYQYLSGGVPAVQGKEQPFATRTWKNLEIIPYNTGDDGRVPYEQHPFQIAKAFCDEYPHGGVIWLHGGINAAELPENKAQVEKAQNDAVRWMRRQIETADRLWHAPDRMQRRNVERKHRACAQRLYDLGIIKALPEWHTEDVNLEDVPTVTCVCGKRPESLATIRCSCGYILNVGEAYKRNIINEESEELERLTRAEVIELGVSDYVAETADEKPRRLKAGVGRPPSKSQERLYEAQEAQTRQGGK